MTKTLLNITELTDEEINTEKDYMLCERLDICMDELDAMPDKEVYALRDTIKDSEFWV